MNIACTQCGQLFSISPEQLGKRGKCPHCRATVILPRSARVSRFREEQLAPPSRLPEHLLCGLVTVVAHLALLVLCAVLPWGDFSEGTAGEGEQILIGQLAREQLVDSPMDRFTPVDQIQPSDSRASESLDASLLDPSTDRAIQPADFNQTLPSMSGSSEQAFEVQSLQNETLLAGGDENFGELVSRLQRDGLDVVIVFDSTRSMQGEIDQVKNRIERIGAALFELVPKTRLGLCTYRDYDDEYVVKGLPLTDNLTEVILYLEGVGAEGGGNRPEAVHRGLEWSLEQNEFRDRARKVILLFGDAPPHPDQSLVCQKLASDFRKQGGVISTVTCRSDFTIPDFDAIAQIGGGESFLTRNEREIMSQLIVLVFGSRHRDKVLEAFQLLDSR